MNEIPVFVQSSELSNRSDQLRKSTMKEFHRQVRLMTFTMTSAKKLIITAIGIRVRVRATKIKRFSP